MINVIFVMGAGHCGSTLLDLILGSHPDAFSLGEFKQLPKRRASKDTQTGEQGEVCGVCVDACPIWDEPTVASIAPLVEHGGLKRALFRRLQNPYRAVAKRTKKSVIVDSSKHPDWIASRLKHKHLWLNMQPCLIYLHRDGRAVTNSYYRKYPDRGYPATVKNWVEQVAEMERYYDEFSAGPKLRLAYEHLASEPGIAMQTVCSALDLNFSESMLRYWEHDHHHLGGNGGTRHLLFRYRAQFAENNVRLQQRMDSSKAHYSHEYYEETSVAIRLDERWRDELDKEHQASFQAFAGAANEPYQWPRV